ncbi:MAG: FtsK/SpoIIIE domain-containing protein, partial [Candidatus Dormibacteraceae bacterium]
MVRRRGAATRSHEVGRAAECAITLDDPALSRVHLLLQVAENGAVIVTDQRSPNGTRVEGRRIDGPTVLSPGQEIEAGHTLLAFTSSRRESAGSLDEQGRLALNRPPRMVPRPPQVEFEVPQAPERRRGSALSVSSTIGGAAMGIVMVVALHSPYFLAFALLGPVVMLGQWVEEKITGRRSFRAEATEFQRRLDDVNEAMARSYVAERRFQRAIAPDLATLALRCAQVSPELWERRAGDPDFLLLRVGWGDTPSRLQLRAPEGGDERLRGLAAQVAATYQEMPGVPVAVPLQAAGSLGLAGGRAPVLAMTRSLVLQVAALHSPEQVMLVAALPPARDEEWRWLGWLPHLRPESAAVPGDSLVTGRVRGRELVDRLLQLLEERRVAAQSAYGAARPSGEAAVVALLDAQAELPRDGVDRLLTEGPALGIHVIWLGRALNDLPGACGTVVEIDAETMAPVIIRPGQASATPVLAADLAPIEVADEMARNLAPIRDVEASGQAADIPRHVSLLELLELDGDALEHVRRSWARDDRRLGARLGIAAGRQPCELSLRYDGPHALAGGMTGAGKSELLQTLVASLAAEHSPERLTFILVDYKGGAAFRDCIQLPHTVGFVTDLDGHLVNRARTSLRAELRYREEVLREHGCRDLVDFEERHPGEAFPSLVIVVDEFAALRDELPEFVDGMVDIAQRGRSLGIHMVLATQRPAGVISDRIRTNTNLRLALRFSDTGDSQDVIGTDDASRPGLPRGRAFMRAGPGVLIEFQAAHASGRTVTDGGPLPVTIHELDVSGDPVDERGSVGLDSSSPTDLMRVVATARQVQDQLRLALPRRPWLDPLPSVLTQVRLEEHVGPEVTSRYTVPIGLLDDPRRQRQVPAYFDLDQDATLLCYGATGSGKTTLLRAIAFALATQLSPDELHLYALDFATRGLRPLGELPHVGAIATGDEPERGQRVLTFLRAEVERRKTLLAAAGASTVAEYNAVSSEQPLPRLLLLLDGYAGFSAAYEDVDFGAPIQTFQELLAEGRSMGLGIVLTGGSSNSVPGKTTASVSRRVVFRMANDDEYSFIGLDRALYHDAHLPPGRGFVDLQYELHAPIVGTDPAGTAQAAALEELGRELRRRYPDAQAPQVRLLPAKLSRDELPAPQSSMEAVPGLLDGQEPAPARLDLLQDGHLLVVGPRRSGRSTTLLAVAGSLAAAPGHPIPLLLLAPRRQSPL